jgi:hypothetical protein
MLTSILAVVTTWLLVGNAATGAPHRSDCKKGECIAFQVGYDWAQSNGIASEFECDGQGSLAFIAGCEAYIADDLADGWGDDPDEDDDEENHVRQHYY